MKRFLTLLFCLLFVSVSIFAQKKDSFRSIQEALGQKVVLYEATESLYKVYGPFMYSEKKGKPKLVQDIETYSEVFDNAKVVEAIAISDIKKKKYFTIESNGQRYHLLMDNNIQYQNYLRSYSYWEKQLQEYQSSVKYYSVSAYNPAIDPYKQYRAIEWLGFEMPTRQNGDVSFSYRDATFTTNNQLTEFGQTKTFLSGYIDTYKEQFIGELVFRTKIEDYLVRKEQERVDSIADYRPIIAKVLHTSGAIEAYKNTGLTYDKDADYEVRLFLGRDLKVTGYEFVGYSLGQEIVLNERDIQFSDPDDASFLKRRGQTGESTRRKVAKESDDEYYQEYLERIHAETQKILDNLNKIHSFYKQKKVFIINQDYAYGEYDQFGLQFRFFNCYDKEIKYVEIRMTPYNVVDDVQADDLGRKTKEVRCIGPIEPLESAEYRFDELWWDEHNIIKYVNVTRIHIIFKDNTTTTFSSKSQVDAHRLSSFSLSEIGIDM